MNTPISRRVALFFLAAAFLALAGFAPARHLESARVLADVAAGEAPSALKARTQAPLRTAVHYRIQGRAHTGDLYLPGEGRPLAGIVLMPGAVPQGKDDPRLTAFVTALARARFVGGMKGEERGNMGALTTVTRRWRIALPVLLTVTAGVLAAALLALLVAGPAAVLYWAATEAIGAVDLRACGLVQFTPMLLIPLLLWLIPGRYTRGGGLVAALASYGLLRHVRLRRLKRCEGIVQ